VNLDIADGEFVTLLGPSGCGKTTLRMIAGLVETSEGQIYFDDQEVSRVPPNRRNVGFLFQSHALFPHLSAFDNVAFGLSVRGTPRASIRRRVEEMLALVNLSGYERRMPAQLSGGQQQRVALARMLATNPRVLLFDEPLSSLDRNLRDQLKHSIPALQQETGKTAVFVTHDQSEAFAISDRIFVMNAGRIEQGGTQLDLYRTAAAGVTNYSWGSKLTALSEEGPGHERSWCITRPQASVYPPVRVARNEWSTAAPPRGSWHIHQWPCPARIATCAPARSAVRLASSSPPVTWSSVGTIARPGRDRAPVRSAPHLAIFGCAAERYSDRMQRPISSPKAAAQRAAASFDMPSPSYRAARCSIGVASCCAIAASPAAGVCQTWARSCQT